MATKLPEKVRFLVKSAELRGHKLVSMGCSQFRCLVCDACGWLDEHPVQGDLAKPCNVRSQKALQ
jgi:hypothetical protein